MIRSKSNLIPIAQKMADMLVLFAVWNTVVWFRFSFISSAQKGLEAEYFKGGLLLIAVTFYFFAKEGIYKSYRLKSTFEEMKSVLRAHSLAAVAFVIILYFTNSGKLSRSVLLVNYLFGCAALIVLRYGVRLSLRYMRRHGRNLRHMALIGSSQTLKRYVHNVMYFPDSGVRFFGWLDSDGEAERLGIKILSEGDAIAAYKAGVDGFVIGYDGENVGKTEYYVKRLHDGLSPVIVIPDTTHSFVGYQLDNIAGVPALFVNEPDYSTINVATKRTFDLVASFLGLLVLSPVFLFLAIGVRLSSPGAIFFGQERVGLDGRRFKMWKFRSMRVGAHVSEDSVPGWTVKDDPRKTKLGSFLRATSLDELPQLWNVFVGEMSLVGPRPEQPYYVEKFRDEIPSYMLRHKMKAGITGWAQVNGWRGDTSLHERIECDLFYIRHWSIWFDIKILFLTFWKGFINKNAY
jgi:exopolysaccharide biosynthesis polyprenyl glycosylphosphotransferase